MALTALIVGIVISVRLAVSGPHDVENLERFQTSSGIDAGPEYAWFASGINGDSAVFTIIAADPFGQGPGHLVENASYRYARAGYSWMSSLLVLAQERLLLAGLTVVGLASVTITTHLAVKLRDEIGLRAWLLIANPSLLIGFTFNTAESLGLTLLALALASGSTTSILGLAIVRPDFLLGVAGWTRQFMSAVVLAIVFRLVWVWHFGDSLFDGAENLGLPFAGLMAEPSLIAAAVVLAGVGTLVVGIVKRNIAWVASGLLVCCFGGFVFDAPINALRAAGVLPVLWAFGPDHRPGFVELRPPLALAALGRSPRSAGGQQP